MIILPAKQDTPPVSPAADAPNVANQLNPLSPDAVHDVAQDSLRRRHQSRPRPTVWKFLLYSSSALGVFFAVKFLVGVWLAFNSPHDHLRLYRPEQSIDEVLLGDRSNVVTPLLDSQDPFDIGIILYARRVDPHSGWPWHNVTQLSEHDPGPRVEGLNWIHGNSALSKYLSFGRALFFPSSSDHVDVVLDAPGFTTLDMLSAFVPDEFHGLSLGDTQKTRKTSIDIPIPMDTLCNPFIRRSDLLVALVPLPTSTKLDNIINVSSYLPELSTQFDLFSTRFPDYQSPNALWPMMIQSLSTARPLFEFHTYPMSDLPPEPFTDAQGEVDDHEDPPPMETHSVYLRTKTYFNIVKETRLLSRKPLARSHDELQKQAQRCLHTFLTMGYLIYAECGRAWPNNGPFETLAQFPDLENGDRLSYGPFLDVDSRATGARDVKLMKIDRDSICSLSAEEQTKRNMTVNMTFGLSVTSPRDKMLSLLFSNRSPARPNAGEHAVIKSQDRTDLWNGFKGYSVDEDSHPRRRIAIYTARAILGFLVTLLTLDYWYRQQTTIGISIVGTILLIIGSEVALVRDIITEMSHHPGPHPSAIQSGRIAFMNLGARRLLEVPIPFFMALSISRLHGALWPRPRLGRWRPTHQERWWARLDKSLLRGWKGRLGGVFFLCVVYYFYLPNQQHVIPTVVPDESLDMDPFSLDYSPEQLLRRECEALVESLMFIGQLSQLALNQRSGKFAGTHRVTAWLMGIRRVISLLLFVPRIVGRFESRPPLTAGEVLDSALVAALWWQAVWLGQIKSDEDDEGDD